MEILEPVTPDKVPNAARAMKQGKWTGLALKIIDAHAEGLVIPVRLADLDEYKTMRNGMADKLRISGYRLLASVVEEHDGTVLAYLQVEEREPPSNGSVVKPGTLRRKRRPNG